MLVDSSQILMLCITHDEYSLVTLSNINLYDYALNLNHRVMTRRTKSLRFMLNILESGRMREKRDSENI
jgi:hypothetical protein